MAEKSSIPLRPEQEAAVRYAREKGTQAPLADIRGRMAGTFARIEGLLASLPEEVVRVRPAPGRWCVQEVVDHLIESHRPAAGQLRSLVRGVRPEGGPVPAGLQSSDPLGFAWPDLLRQLSEVHRELLAAVDSASEDTPLEAKAPVLLVVKVKEEDGRTVPVEWVQDFDWKAFAILFRAHTLEHVGQIERTLEAIRPEP